MSLHYLGNVEMQKSLTRSISALPDFDCCWLNLCYSQLILLLLCGSLNLIVTGVKLCAFWGHSLERKEDGCFAL